MARSEVERVAWEITREFCLSDGGPDPRYVVDATRIMRLARWHLRAVRRARGRTVGWCLVEGACASEVYTRRDVLADCRVVLVPRRKR